MPSVLAADDPINSNGESGSSVRDRQSKEKGADKGIYGRSSTIKQRGHDKASDYFGQGGKATYDLMSRTCWGSWIKRRQRIGVLISMDEPTKNMRAAASLAGFYESGWGAGQTTKHPRLQLLTIADLLDGQIIDMPPGKTCERSRRPLRSKGRSSTGRQNSPIDPNLERKRARLALRVANRALGP